MKTAEFIRRLDGWQGDARLYKLSEPLAEERWDDDEEEVAHDYVIVSGVRVFSGPETYIFPATPEGEPINFGELPGSFRGLIDHAKALEKAGYETRWRTDEDQGREAQRG